MITDGILNINKPEGWTSQDVCAKLRGRLHIKKIGHTGTLDPMATGVLPVCIGNATRTIEYYDKDYKSYHAAMKLGVTTDTLDITGAVISENKIRIADGNSVLGANVVNIANDNQNVSNTISISRASIEKAFADYVGKIEQIPPKYSAIRINGRRAYDMARDGMDVEIKPRKIIIKSNTITSIDAENGIIEFDVVCSKGTYIRTICDDIGKVLGCGATMTSLTRTSNGYFKLEDAINLSSVIEMTDEEIEQCIIPADMTLTKLGHVNLIEGRAIAFGNGHPSSSRTFHIVETSNFDNLYKVYAPDFLGIGEIRNNELIPIKVMK